MGTTTTCYPPKPESLLCKSRVISTSLIGGEGNAAILNVGWIGGDSIGGDSVGDGGGEVNVECGSGDGVV